METKDLNELMVPKIKIGEPARVSIEALNAVARGKVIAIAPVAGVLGGDVVYKTTVALDSPPAGLRAGMSVEVTFGE